MSFSFQPIVLEGSVLRFKPNPIVVYLLANSGLDMNHLAECDFSDEDRMQFAQLIGYSCSGFSDLSYTTDDVRDQVLRLSNELLHPNPANEIQ